jgi:transposase
MTRWLSKEEEALRMEMLAKGMTYPEMAKALGRTAASISSWGLRAKRRFGIKPDNRELVLGPYGPPPIDEEGFLEDAIEGRVKVGKWSNAPVPWPCKDKPGQKSLVVCGGLIEALHNESASAVAYNFGVSTQTIAKWCKALGVRRNSHGKNALYQAYRKKGIARDSLSGNLLDDIKKVFPQLDVSQLHNLIVEAGAELARRASDPRATG